MIVMMRALKTKLEEVGISCSKNQLLIFQKYHDLILKWNVRTNLVSFSDRTRIVERHFLESIAVLGAVEIERGAKILDVGSGAGFPAIPISIIRPDLNFILTESKRKKVLFLKGAIAELALKNVRLLEQRCEKIADTEKYHLCFDFVFCRAIGKLSLVYGWVQKLIKPGGQMVAWKGSDVSGEINDLISQRGDHQIIQIIMDERLVRREKDKKFVVVKVIR
jgi:16S rRNA (guanine527-N7)-methyltransferase